MSVCYRRGIYFFITSLLALRLIAMWLIPLTDDTEARYGEIARKMAENGNWVTPMGLHEPFWAKPPLSTWVSAASMKWFDVSAFAARLPNLLLMLLVVGMVAIFIGRKQGKDAALVTALIAGSMLLLFITGGTVMTDTALVLATTWGLLAFWLARETGQKRWGYLLFAALGVGLLAKGPVAIALTGLPIFIWALWQRDLKACICCLPWVGGLLLMLTIALPWYLMAEYRTPGFLHYFVIGENIERFIKPGWSGDKFGSAHLRPYGMVWLYWLGAALPWSFLVIAWLVKSGWRGVQVRFTREHGLARYLLLAAFMPEIFFTFSSNIIATYPLVGLPPLAALIVLQTRDGQLTRGWTLPSLATVTVVLGLVMILAFRGLPGEMTAKNSQQPVIEAWKQHRSSDEAPIAYYKKHYYSAHFYSHGQVRHLDDEAALKYYLAENPHAFVVVHKRQRNQLPESVSDSLVLVQRYPFVSLFSARGSSPGDGK